MALTSAEVDVCNQALSKFGSFTLDYSDTTGTSSSGMAGNVANKCLIHYEQTRNALLKQAYWNFASTRLTLVGDWETATIYTTDQYVWVDDVLYKCNTAHTSTIWITDYIMDGTEYVMDGDDYVRDNTIDFNWDIVTDRCLFEYSYRYAVPTDFMRMKPKYFEENWLEARLEGNYIITDETEMEFKYIKKVTNTTEFDPLFTEVLVCDLALKLISALASIGYVALATKKDIQQERKDVMRRARAVCDSENKKLNYNQWVNARYGTGIV